MCGIYGIVGNTNTIDVVKTLERLEYRGYDSCGLAYVYQGRCFLDKTVGNTANLNKIVIKRNIGCALGHTRWATHGNVTPVNAHPHTTELNRFYVVHNGVIDNYDYLRDKYKFNFITQTDSEIIVRLLDYYCRKYNTLEAIKKIIVELEGSFAVVILDKEDNNKLYFLKNKSPLLIGLDDKKVVLASDQSVFDAKTNITVLNDNNYGYITNSSFEIFSINEYEKWNTFFKDEDTKTDKVNDYYMLDEIKYEPFMIEDISKKYSTIDLSEFNSLIASSKEIAFVGAGSSYYAGCILQQHYESKLKKRCYSIVASELKFFPLLYKDILFIFLSQSGETADLCEGLEYLKKKNYKVIALCNNVNSSLGYKSDIILPLFAKSEIAVASTKAFSAMVYVGRLILDKDLYCNLSTIISKDLTAVLKKWEKLNDISNSISKTKNAFFLGKSIDYYMALEGALKLREITYISSFAFQSGELKHGSIALIDNDSVCIGILSDISLKNIVRSNLEEVRSRGAKAYLISNCDKDADIYVEGDILSLVLALQIIAYQSALILNRNIDQPRNLAKSVTVL